MRLFILGDDEVAGTSHKRFRGDPSNLRNDQLDETERDFNSSSLRDYDIDFELATNENGNNSESEDEEEESSSDSEDETGELNNLDDECNKCWFCASSYKFYCLKVFKVLKFLNFDSNFSAV